MSTGRHVASLSAILVSAALIVGWVALYYPGEKVRAKPEPSDTPTGKEDAIGSIPGDTAASRDVAKDNRSPFSSGETPRTERYQVQVSAIPSLDDQTVVSPTLKAGQYKQVMVLPPSGTARGVFEKTLVSAEGELLKRNLGVTSPAVTSRVVFEGGENNAVQPGGSELSPLDRALLLGKQTNADLVVQIGAFEWVTEGATRYFVGENEQVREVTRQQHEDHVGFKYSISTHQLRFSGRLVEIEQGATMATFNMTGSLFGYLPRDYVTIYQWNGSQSTLVSEDFRWNDAEWIQVAMRRLSDDIFSRVAEYIAGKK
ncbi:MAG: hypothetical protein HY719_01835 [Planctomycetes bacterium]|nr:hypothetical protein [Planctomycetota bacterium]